MIAKSWRNCWAEIIPFFKFSPEIRKAVYTTKAIEWVKYTIEKIIKHRQFFRKDEAVMKLIFMDLKNISGKWTMPIGDKLPFRLFADLKAHLCFALFRCIPSSFPRLFLLGIFVVTPY
ncbi:MAG: transposase [Treponema sp.]|nr:transposase [Treponema sp.]